MTPEAREKRARFEELRRMEIRDAYYYSIRDTAKDVINKCVDIKVACRALWWDILSPHCGHPVTLANVMKLVKEEIQVIKEAEKANKRRDKQCLKK
jgi:hypothetical protein